MQSATMTAEDVARLAGVTRQAVTNWRRRPNTAAGILPFPAPLAGRGVERFAADEVVDWLEQTGRGRNAELRADAPAFALPDGLSIDDVVTMLTLRGLSDGDLAGLSVFGLATLAFDVDPDDEFLRTEVLAAGANNDLLAYVDDLHESAFGLVDALDRAQRSRLGRTGQRGLTDAAIGALVSVTTACRLFLGGDAVALDPRLDAATARALVGGFAGVTTASGHVQGRALRRQLALADIELVRSASTVRVLSVVGDNDEAALQAIDDVVLDLAKTDLAVILGPSALLCDGLRGQLDARRSETLSGRGLVMAVRLPRGLWSNAHRQQLGLWIVAGVEKESRVVVADLTSESLDVDDLASDIAAALTFDSVRLLDAARSFRYGRAVDRAALGGRRPLVAPGIRAIRMGDAAHADQRDRVLAATLVTSQPLAGFDIEVAPAGQAVVGGHRADAGDRGERRPHLQVLGRCLQHACARVPPLRQPRDPGARALGRREGGRELVPREARAGLPEQGVGRHAGLLPVVGGAGVRVGRSRDGRPGCAGPGHRRRTRSRGGPCHNVTRRVRARHRVTFALPDDHNVTRWSGAGSE